MLAIEFAELSDAGRAREHNEDCVGHVLPTSPGQVESQGWLFALADGVGGQEKGEVASRLAIEKVLAEFKKIPKGVMHVSLLPRLVQKANEAVYDAGHAQQGRGPAMGTTLVACALRFDSAVIAHVGDSRCYLFRNGNLSVLTRDHTMANEQLRLGLIGRKDADTGDGRNVLTRCLGNELFVAADTLTVTLVPEDRLMLCSDGLHGYVSDSKIRKILDSYEAPQKAAAALIDAANQAGGHDNVSVQLIRITSVQRMGLYRGRPYRLL